MEQIDFQNETIARQQIQNLIFNNQKTIATENIAKHLEKIHFFKSIRNDKDMEIWIYQDGIYKPNGKSYILEYTRDILGFMFTTQLGTQVVAKIYTDTFIDQDIFFNQQNERPEILPVQNGLLNIETKKLYSFTPDKYFFTKINASFNSEAKCNKFIEWLKQIVANDKDVKTIQEIFGFCLLRDYRFEKGFMFYGALGRNGKSKLLTLLKSFLSVENISGVSLSDIERDQFSIINFHNKLANISADLSEYAINNTGMYKSLTGRDLINANRKGLTYVKFVNYAKMIFATNDLPMVKNFSSAFSLRWVMINFPYQFLPQNEIDILEDKTNVFLQNQQITDGLEDEFDGILNWALEGLERLRTTKYFSNETNSNVVRKYWLRKSNSVSAFVEDCIDLDYDSKLLKKDFRRIYHDYCKTNNIKQMSDKVIAITLSNELGISEIQFRTQDGERERFWEGIKFKELIINNTDMVLDHLKRVGEQKTKELLKIFGEGKEKIVFSCLKTLEQEGSIVEIPAGTWRLKK